VTPSPEVAIIGAGPAGLAAATEAATRGVRVTLIDDNPLPGGQYFRQGATEALRKVARDALHEDEQAAALLRIVEHPRVDYHSEAVVFGYFDDDVLAYVQDGQVRELRPRCTIIAAGATERPVPFPGWTLPGVMGAGGALNLIKGQRVLPGRRVLVSGNGPLGLLVAATLVRLGATVIELIEAAHGPRLPWSVPWLLVEPGTLARGLGYRATLMRAGVPYRWGHTVIEARGDQRVEEAVVAPIDAHGGVDHTRSRVIEVDTVVTGFGLVPSTEITRSLGCAHVHEAEAGGWIPVRSADTETTQANVFSVGDCAGVGGANTALVEGRLAGLAAAVRLGQVGETEADRLARHLCRRLRRLRRFRSAMAMLFSAPHHFLSLLTDDTIVCRCEDVTARQFHDRLQAGVVDIESLKGETRMSMGRCQGRNCLVALAALIARHTGCDVADIRLPQSRPPMRPVLIGSLIEHGESLAERRGMRTPAGAWADE